MAIYTSKKIEATTMLLATLIHRASLPCPQVGPDQAARLLEQYYGLTGIAACGPGQGV